MDKDFVVNHGIVPYDTLCECFVLQTSLQVGCRRVSYGSDGEVDSELYA